jgi:adenylate cyclase
VGAALLVLLGLFALIGWGQVRVGRVGVSRSELALLFCDLALLTFVAVAPNPFSSAHWPVAMQYHFGNFIYFFVLLSGATLAYSWLTVHCSRKVRLAAMALIARVLTSKCCDSDPL